MGAGILGVLGLGFLLGIRHAVEPDHIVAVSTIACQSKKLWRAALTGVFWGLGHTVALFVVGISLLLLRRQIPDRWALAFEFGIGIMLVLLGLASLRRRQEAPVHAHSHSHDGTAHSHYHQHGAEADHSAHSHRVSYWRPALIGVLHGMAGSAGMVVMTMSVAGGLWEAASYMLCFGLGTVVGMLASTTAIGLPFVLSSRNGALHSQLVRLSGVVSVAFGFYYMYSIGIVEGLFQL